MSDNYQSVPIKLERYDNVPFDHLKRVNFLVDGAVGLPCNCTVTRVTSRLIYPDRREVACVASGDTLSDPDMSCFSPTYALSSTWEGISPHLSA